MALSVNPKHVKRYGQIASLLIRHGRRDVARAGLDAADAPHVQAEARADDDPVARAESLVSELERMGPTFIKLGQLLSSRVDLLPPAYTEALARLEDRVAPVPWQVIEDIVSVELGVRLSKAFVEFEREPIASASLGQVHRAVLRDGRPVAVKVQRPGIRERVREDVEALGELAPGTVVLQCVRVAGEHGFRLPAELTLIGKTLFHLDQVARTLDPELDPNAAIRRHATEMFERRMTASLRPAALFRAALDANEFVQRMPQRLNRIFDLLAENRLSIGVDAIDEKQTWAAGRPYSATRPWPWSSSWSPR